MAITNETSVTTEESEMSTQPQPHVRGFFFWSLAPFLVVFIVAMPFLVPNSDARSLAGLVAIEVLAALVLLGLFDSMRFAWAWRGVGAMVFLLYLGYLTIMLLQNNGAITVTPRRSTPSIFNAICGLIVFGLPGMWYAVFGRLTLKKQEFPEPSDDAEPAGYLDEDV